MLMWSKSRPGALSRSGALGRVSVDILLLLPARELDRLPVDRLIASQRVADPGIGQHDAGQVRMVGEGHSEQVVHLALVPVQPRKNAHAARRLAGRTCLEAEPGE